MRRIMKKKMVLLPALFVLATAIVFLFLVIFFYFVRMNNPNGYVDLTVNNANELSIIGNGMDLVSNAYAVILYSDDGVLKFRAFNAKAYTFEGSIIEGDLIFTLRSVSQERCDVSFTAFSEGQSQQIDNAQISDYESWVRSFQIPAKIGFGSPQGNRSSLTVNDKGYHLSGVKELFMSTESNEWIGFVFGGRLTVEYADGTVLKGTNQNAIDVENAFHVYGTTFNEMRIYTDAAKVFVTQTMANQLSGRIIDVDQIKGRMNGELDVTIPVNSSKHEGYTLTDQNIEITFDETKDIVVDGYFSEETFTASALAKEILISGKSVFPGLEKWLSENSFTIPLTLFGILLSFVTLTITFGRGSNKPHILVELYKPVVINLKEEEAIPNVRERYRDISKSEYEQLKEKGFSNADIQYYRNRIPQEFELSRLEQRFKLRAQIIAGHEWLNMKISNKGTCAATKIRITLNAQDGILLDYNPPKYTVIYDTTIRLPDVDRPGERREAKFVEGIERQKEKDLPEELKLIEEENNVQELDSNHIEIQTKELMHYSSTRVTSVFVIGVTPGTHYIECQIMCDEYKKPEKKRIKVRVNRSAVG